VGARCTFAPVVSQFRQREKTGDAIDVEGHDDSRLQDLRLQTKMTGNTRSLPPTNHFSVSAYEKSDTRI